MLTIFICWTGINSLSAENSASQDSRISPEAAARLAKIQAIPGLITLIDFNHSVDGIWTTRGGSLPNLPIHLRRLDDERAYNVANWPFTEGPSALRFDSSGPFGRALRCYKGYIYAEIPRTAFDGTALDRHGRCSGTLVAWAKFTGKRHFVAGIWDEGGWNRYAGKRQYALFGGLFKQGNSLTAHISTTGAACYPQSTAPGSQYARMRAIDGAEFPDHRWVSMAMTWDTQQQKVTAWVDGVATPRTLTDPVVEDVQHPAKPLSANPYTWCGPMFGPRNFILTFNGYGAIKNGISEHWLECDLNARKITYGRTVVQPSLAQGSFTFSLDFQREGKSLLKDPLSSPANHGLELRLPTTLNFENGDEVVATLNHNGQQVGTTLRRRLDIGAPFTIGRALGLHSGPKSIESGTDIAIDGIAVFDRALSAEELREISFASTPKEYRLGKP